MLEEQRATESPESTTSRPSGIPEAATTALTTEQAFRRVSPGVIGGDVSLPPPFRRFSPAPCRRSRARSAALPTCHGLYWGHLSASEQSQLTGQLNKAYRGCLPGHRGGYGAWRDASAHDPKPQ